MKVWINLYGFRHGAKELVFDRVMALDPGVVRPHLNQSEIADDPDLANPYEISEAAVATLTGEASIPPGSYFVNQVQSDEPLPQ